MLKVKYTLFYYFIKVYVIGGMHVLNKERFCIILVGYLIILFKEVIKKTNRPMYSRTCFIVFKSKITKIKKLNILYKTKE